MRRFSAALLLSILAAGAIVVGQEIDVPTINEDARLQLPPPPLWVQEKPHDIHRLIHDGKFPKLEGNYLLRESGAVYFRRWANLTICASGCTYTNSQLQTALNAAVGGDEVLLQEDFVYAGCYSLPDHSGASYVIFRTGVTSTGTLLATNPGNFPTSTQQMNPTRADTANLAKIQCNLGGSGAPALRAKWSSTQNVGRLPVSAYWHLKWLDLTNTDLDGPILEFGYTGTGTFPTLAHQPHHFIVDQMYIHGDQYRGGFVGLRGAAADVTVKLSWISDIWSRTGWEGQAINIVSPSKNWLIEDTYVSCGTECFMAGGSGGGATRAVSVQSAGRTQSAMVLDDVNDLFVGRGIAIDVGGRFKHTVVASCGTSVAGAACTSNSITVSPALEAIPDSPGRARWGQLIEDVTIRRNTFSRPLWQRDAIIPVVTGLSVTKSETGGTLSGTVCYRVTQRRAVSKSTATSAATPENCVTFTGSTGSATVQFNAGPTIDTYYIYRGPSGSTNQRFSINSPQVSFVDTGGVGITETAATSGNTVNVKNLFEIKNGTRFTVEGNLLENNWAQAQLGMAVLFTPAPSTIANPSTEMVDITFRHNIIRRAAGGFQLFGRSQTCDYPSMRTKRVTITNNLWYDLGPQYGSTQYWAFLNAGQATNSTCGTPYGPLPVTGLGALDVAFTHNTVDMSGGNGLIFFNTYGSGYYNPYENITVSDNSFRRAGKGLFGNFSCGEGNDCWTDHTTGTRVWQNNLTEGITPANYPNGAGENLTATVAQWQGYYTDISTGNYRPTGSTPLDNAASDGTDIGANLDTIESVMGGAPAPPSGANPPNIPAQTLPNAVIGSPYEFQIVVEGGTLPNTCAAISGLPANSLSLVTSECKISAINVSGSPTTLTIQVQATDDDARTSNTQTFTLPVVAAPAALTITTTSPLPSGTVGVDQVIQFQASGGVPPYRDWAATVAAQLPEGKSIDLDTGLYSGVPLPAAEGANSFTLSVQDSAGTVVTKTFSHPINAGTATNCPERRREDRGSGIPRQGAFFVGPTAPVECVETGDLWMDTSVNPAILNRARSSSPNATFTPINVATVTQTLLNSAADTEPPSEAIPQNSLLFRNENDKWAVFSGHKDTSGFLRHDAVTGWSITTSGAGLTQLQAGAISTGVVDVARIGTGTKNSTTVYHGDGVFRVPSGGGGWTPITYALIDHEVDTSPGSSGAYVEVPANNRRRKFIPTTSFNTVQMYVQHGDAAATYNVKLQYCSSLAFPTCNTWTDLGSPLTMDPTVFVWSRTSEITLPAGAKSDATWFRIQMTNTAGASTTITLYNVHLIFRP